MTALPFKVKAIYDYSSPHDDDLNFFSGQIINVTEEEDNEWYVGEYTGEDGVKKDGLFPRNFVERYEPQAPPRPARSRPKAEVQPPPEPDIATATQQQPELDTSTTRPLKAEPPSAETEPVEQATGPEHIPGRVEPPPAPKPQPAKPTPTAASAKPAAPETASKPTSSSFKDRIAAFNKPAAPPVAPKPSGAPANQNFIKKPFVAPPPSRNAYVPSTAKQDAPQKVYRREEDPEIAQRVAQDQKEAEEAGLAGEAAQKEEVGEEAPKATSLKDRIALLQKQQQEQAARRAEGATKHKRPPQSPTEPEDVTSQESQADVTSPVGSARDSSDLRRPFPARLASHEEDTDDLARDTLSDGNEADQSGAGETTEDAGGDSTEVEELASKSRTHAPPPPPRTLTSESREAPVESIEKGEDEAEGQEEEEDVDPETRRKEELRARMAKMSGGMGMPGMFGMPPPRAPATGGKPSVPRRTSSEARSPPPQQRVPMVPMPGAGPRVQSPRGEEDPAYFVQKEREPSVPDTRVESADAVPDVEDLSPLPHSQAHSTETQPPPIAQVIRQAHVDCENGSQKLLLIEVRNRSASGSHTRDGPPPIPSNRPSAEPQARAVPPPPPRRTSMAKDSDDDDDDADENPLGSSLNSREPLHVTSGLHTDLPRRGSVRQPPATHTTADKAPSSPPLAPQTSPPSHERRVSRAPPPIPAGSPRMPPLPAQQRPPPPPPPSAAPAKAQPHSRSSTDTGDGIHDEERDSEYEGDYDTDIAPTASHKEALKSKTGRDASLDEDNTLSGVPTGRSPAAPPPPLPTTQRTAPPPPPPSQAPPRRSADIGRPPPPPPPRQVDEDEYDPYRYDEEPTPPSRASTGRSEQPQPLQSTVIPPPQDSQQRPPISVPAAGSSATARVDLVPEARSSMDESRPSLQASRKSMTGRRSMDPGSRPFTDDGGRVARDVDLARSSMWWAHSNSPPPAFHNRSDILFECEEATTSKRGGRSTTNKDVYILFPDYSQTIITAQYDAKDPSHDVHLEQRHEEPPHRLRQDQLEAVYSRFGEPIAAMAMAKQNQTVGDGTPQALVMELMRSSDPNVLLPVGNRAYGAVVYSNMANSSVSQYDEIRPGDLVSFKNAKFKGKHGAMHAKYSMDVGKPDHVAVVMEWDGTKKKIRALEQGREKAKSVKLESFRVGDLGGGEVKVWRVVGRDYVGWESNG
ncbi:MAG: hypothetical protein Q9162_002457 [Coniocarpon cinnabarinum]